MAVKIRLQRKGTNKKAFYRVVAVDGRVAAQRAEIETLGHYNPKDPENRLKINKARVDYWLSVGAQASSTVKSLLSRAVDLSEITNSPASTEEPANQNPPA